MAENTKIEWATHTFNPWVGCTKISPACDNCYAEGWAKRCGIVKWGTHEPRVRTSAENWKQPLKWNRDAKIAQNAWEEFKRTNPGLTDAELIEKGFVKPKRPRVFCASLADVFDNAVPDEWRADLFTLIAATPYLDWLLLTKRIGNVEKMLRDAICGDVNGFQNYSHPLIPHHDNVWLGITVSNQQEADRDIPKLIKNYAGKRFLSIEPMLGEIELKIDSCRDPFYRVNPCPIDWVICGGESGSKARPLNPQWVRNLRDQCAAADVPFFFKQWGEWLPRSSVYHKFLDGTSLEEIDPDCKKWDCVRHDDVYMQRVGKKKAGRLLDGREWNEVPN